MKKGGNITCPIKLVDFYFQEFIMTGNPQVFDNLHFILEHRWNELKGRQIEEKELLEIAQYYGLVDQDDKIVGTIPPFEKMYELFKTYKSETENKSKMSRVKNTKKVPKKVTKKRLLKK